MSDKQDLKRVVHVHGFTTEKLPANTYEILAQHGSIERIIAFRTRTTSKPHLFVQYTASSAAQSALGKKFVPQCWQGDPVQFYSVGPVWEVVKDREDVYEWDGKEEILPEFLPAGGDRDGASKVQWRHSKERSWVGFGVQDLLCRKGDIPESREEDQSRWRSGSGSGGAWGTRAGSVEAGRRVERYRRGSFDAAGGGRGTMKLEDGEIFPEGSGKLYSDRLVGSGRYRSREGSRSRGRSRTRSKSRERSRAHLSSRSVRRRQRQHRDEWPSCSRSRSRSRGRGAGRDRDGDEHKISRRSQHSTRSVSRIRQRRDGPIAGSSSAKEYENRNGSGKDTKGRERDEWQQALAPLNNNDHAKNLEAGHFAQRTAHDTHHDESQARLQLHAVDRLSLNVNGNNDHELLLKAVPIAAPRSLSTMAIHNSPPTLTATSGMKTATSTMAAEQDHSRDERGLFRHLPLPASNGRNVATGMPSTQRQLGCAASGMKRQEGDGTLAASGSLSASRLVQPDEFLRGITPFHTSSVEGAPSASHGAGQGFQNERFQLATSTAGDGTRDASLTKRTPYPSPQASPMFDNSLWLHHDGAGAMNAVHLEQQHRSFPSIHSSPQSLLSLIEFHASQVAKYRELYKSSQVELTLERAAKRKSEDEVDRERAMRRKLEDQVWEMKTNEKSSF